LSLVAPCFAPEAQLLRSRRISHHTPTYFIGFTHDTSPRRMGSLRLRISEDSTRSPARVAICSVRHGVLKGVATETFAAVPLPGVSAALSLRPSTRVRFMPE